MGSSCNMNAEDAEQIMHHFFSFRWIILLFGNPFFINLFLTDCQSNHTGGGCYRCGELPKKGEYNV